MDVQHDWNGLSLINGVDALAEVFTLVIFINVDDGQFPFVCRDLELVGVSVDRAALFVHPLNDWWILVVTVGVISRKDTLQFSITESQELLVFSFKLQFWW